MLLVGFNFYAKLFWFQRPPVLIFTSTIFNFYEHQLTRGDLTLIVLAKGADCWGNYFCSQCHFCGPVTTGKITFEDGNRWGKLQLVSRSGVDGRGRPVGRSFRMGRVYKWNWTMYSRVSHLQFFLISLLFQAGIYARHTKEQETYRFHMF